MMGGGGIVMVSISDLIIVSCAEKRSKSDG